MTFKHKCGVCGEVLIPAYTQYGQPIFICPNFKGRTTKYGNNLYTLEIWCDLQPQQPHIKPPPFRPQTTQQKRAYETSLKYDGMFETFQKIVANRYLTELKTHTYGILSEIELLKQTNLALELELPILKIPLLFQNAIKLGRALGLHPKKAIEAISKGIGRKSWMILDNIGITIKRGLKNEDWVQTAIQKVLQKGSELPDPTNEEIENFKIDAETENGLIRQGKKFRAR